MKVAGRLNDGVGADHPTDNGVVDAAVHVDEIEVAEHFVSGVTAIGDGSRRGLRPSRKGGPVVGVSLVSPGVVALVGDDWRGRGIGNADDGAEVVFVEPAFGNGSGAVGGGGFLVNADPSGGGVDIDAAVDGCPDPEGAIGLGGVAQQLFDFVGFGDVDLFADFAVLKK